jgi:predicted nucleotidyltransferase
MTIAFDPATLDRRVVTAVGEHPHPLTFITISGAHLYGFPSPDSDYDLRGVHLLPAARLLGLEVTEETVERSEVRDGLEIDYVTHDLKKFIGMMLRRNGYVLEQLYSPLVVRTSPVHERLKELGVGCITRHHVHHYRGFAHTQWELFHKERPRRVKPLLYVFRVLLTGIHLLESGQVEANLEILNRQAKLPYIPDLIARKGRATEQATLVDDDLALYEAEFHRLLDLLEQAATRSTLPEEATARRALEELLISTRLATVSRA